MINRRDIQDAAKASQARNSQNMQWIGQVVSADTTGGLCLVNVRGRIVSCAIPDGAQVTYGSQVSVSRVPGQARLVVNAGGNTTIASQVIVPISAKSGGGGSAEAPTITPDTPQELVVTSLGNDCLVAAWDDAFLSGHDAYASVFEEPSWGEAIQLSVVGDTGATTQNPSCASSFVAYSELGHIYVVRYDAETSLWGTRVKIDTDAGTTCSHPCLVMDGLGTLHAVWSQAVSSFDQVFYSYSSDSGAIWSVPTQLSATTMAHYYVFPCIATNVAGDLIAIWETSIYLPSVVSSRYKAHGGTWAAEQVAFSDPTIMARFPRISITTGGIAYAVCTWTDDIYIIYTVIAANIRAVGGTWGTPALISTTHYGNTGPSVVAAPNNTYAVAIWKSSLPSVGFQVWYSIYSGGNWAVNSRLDDAVTDILGEISTGLCVSADSTIVHAVWTDGRTGTNQIRHAILSGGVWGGSEEVGPHAAAQMLPSISMATSASGVLLEWSSTGLNTAEYLIERSLTVDPDDFEWISTVPVERTTYTDTGITADTSYWYRVRAQNKDTVSGYSNIATVTT